MMKEIVSLVDLKAPIKIESSDNQDRPGVKELDEINKALFEAGKDSKRYVQIITNKPRSVFYVATVTTPPTPVKLFKDMMLGATPLTGMDPNPRILLVDRAQELEAKEYRARFVRGLRAVHGVSGEDEDSRKSFDGR
jgi:hypothetical protein